MKTEQPEETADKTWVYVEPYLYKNADSGRYYSRLGRQGFRALKTDRVTVARLRLAAAGVRDDTQIHTHLRYAEFNDIIAAIAALDADVMFPARLRISIIQTRSVRRCTIFTRRAFRRSRR